MEASLSAANQMKKSLLKVVSCELQKPFVQETFFEAGGSVSPYARSEFLKGDRFQKNFRLLMENQSYKLD